MTNREYFRKKKEVFMGKADEFLETHFLKITITLWIIDLFLIFCVFKVNVAFLGLFIPITIVSLTFTGILVDDWLDKEHKE